MPLLISYANYGTDGFEMMTLSFRTRIHAPALYHPLGGIHAAY